MNRYTRAIKLSSTLLVILTPVFFTCETRAADAPSLHMVYNALGDSVAPVWVAQELGLFAKQGLQHNLNYLAPTTAVQTWHKHDRRPR